MNRRTIAILVSLFPIILGLVDVLLRMIYLHSFKEGIYFSIHDPGRMVHSFVLLPVSIYILIVNFPLANIKASFSKLKIVICIMFVFLEFLAVFQAYHDARDGYNNRLPMPYNLREGRNKLVKLHHSIMEEINNYKRLSFSKSEYQKHIKEFRKPYLEYSNKVKGPADQFWYSTTFYTKFSIFVTFIGISYVIILFTIIAFFALERKRIDDSLLKAFIINAAVLSSWFIFRAYSEWYLNLGDFDVQKDAKFIVLPFDTVVLLVTVFFLYQKKKFLSYIASGCAVLISLVVILIRLKPDLFFSSITFPSDLSIENIISMLFTSAFGIGTLIWNFKSRYSHNEVKLVSVQEEESDKQHEKNDIGEIETLIATKFTLPDELTNKYIMNITEKLCIQKAYLNPELTLSKLSKDLDIPLHHLSHVLNYKMRQGFSDLINQYRIEEAKQKLKDPTFRNIKIETIGYECGFNSKATFYRVFKKSCNQSPSEFQKPFVVEIN
jgi:AraC-like DNA-binding protein